MTQSADKTEQTIARSIELMNKARSRDAEGNPSAALELVEQAEQLRRTLPASEFTGAMPPLLLAKAGLLRSLRREGEALGSLTEAERIYKEEGDLRGMARTLGLRIEILRQLGRMQEAVVQVGRKMAAELGQMPSDAGLPPDYWPPKGR